MDGPRGPYSAMHSPFGVHQWQEGTTYCTVDGPGRTIYAAIDGPGGPSVVPQMVRGNQLLCDRPMHSFINVGVNFCGQLLIK